MNILITGASGFLGRHLSVFLEKKGHNVTKITSKEIDLTNQHSCENIPKLNYHQIYHLAAWTQAGDFCQHHQGEQWIINQQINTNVLNWWKMYCPTAKMIAFGTSASYAPNIELVEENYMTGSPLDKYYAYAMTKRMLLAGLQSLNKQFDMNYLYFVPSTIYGPFYHVDKRELHFIYDIIRKILDYKYFNKKIILWGDGEQTRELIFVDDCVNIIYEVEKSASNIVCNLSSEKSLSIKEFAKICCDIVGVDFSNISFNINEFVGFKSKSLNTNKMNLFSKVNETSYISGLEATINWYETTNYSK